MKYCSIRQADIANGEGFRVSLFVSGCARNCKGCFNKEAQDPAFGKTFDDKAKQKIFKELEHDWCRGLSLLGGEPLSKLSDNRKVIIELAKEIKNWKENISKAVSGEKNGCYGRKWMHLKGSSRKEDRVYVRENEFKKYLDKGYIFGMKEVKGK